jgi:hypothetical protein
VIDAYLNQTVIWKQKVDTNTYAEPVFAPDQPIRVRWEPRNRLISDRRAIGGEVRQVTSQARVYCREDVKLGDHLVFNGAEWPVLSVDPQPGLFGDMVFREVMV